MKQVRWALSHMMQAGVPKASTLDDIMAKWEELLGR
jgi:hypothetical protein